MRNKKFDQDFRNEFHKEYNCDLVLNEVKPFEGFSNSKKLKNLYFWKFSTFSLSFLIITISIVFTIIYSNKPSSIKYRDRIDHVYVKDDSDILTEDNKNYMMSLCDDLFDSPYYYLMFDKSISVYIYRGEKYNSNNEIEIIYFYIVSYEQINQNNVIIKIEEDEKIIDTNKSSGVLATIVKDKEIEEILFSVIFNNVEKEYILQN